MIIMHSRYWNECCYIVAIIFYAPLIIHAQNNLDSGNLQYLDIPNHNYHCCSAMSALPHLEIFCYRGKEKAFIHMWQTVLLECSLASDEYEYYEGPTPADVIKEYEIHRSSWKLDLFTYSWKEKVIRLSPFNISCVGINSNSVDYNVKLQVTRIDFWRVILLVSGITLFVWAPKLGSNTLFFYICGIVLGICSSLLILVFLISKMIPRGPVMYGFVVGGWTLGVCLLQLMYDNLRLIAADYQRQVGMYIAATGLISFVVCYRMGPVTDPRSKNLIQWALQGASLVMIYLSSEFHEAIIVILSVLLAVWYFGTKVRTYLKGFWYRRFPPERHLLSIEEYTLETTIATNSALEELRAYCSSPEVNAWEYVTRISRPVLFAGFVEGGSHLSPEEIENHRALHGEDLLSVSEDESD